MILEITNLLKGKLGNLVVCKRGDKVFIRTKPDKVKQTAATKKSSSNFRLAVSAAKTFRALLLPVLHFPKDKEMQNAFNGAIYRWLRNSGPSPTSSANGLTSILAFSFNQRTSVAGRWRVDFSFSQHSDKEIELHIPSFIPSVAINAPANTRSVNCTIAAACVRLSDAKAIGHDHFSMVIKHDKEIVPAQSKLLSVKTKEGCLVIVAAAMTYQLSNGRSDTRRAFLTNSVIGAWYVS